MCGIVGYVGTKCASDVLVSGLKKLEYRGYDSCGIATIFNEQINLQKTTKRISDLEQIVNKSEESKNATIGIGHTRWATHGAATIINAHPHVSQSKRFVVVHNGIIENYIQLREKLIKEGFNFYSETDTEVIPNLIEKYYKGNLLEAVKKTTDKLEGSYALVIMDRENPDMLVATRRNSPLIVGIGNNENYIASDFSAIIKYTNRISILENNEFAVVEKKGIHFYDSNLNKQRAKIKKCDIKDEDSEKNGYEHFMLKEINENTLAIKNTLDNYVKNDKINLNLKITDKELKSINNIHIVACGTATHAGLFGKNIIEKLARKNVLVEAASEFRYKDPILDPNDLVIFISQSGETADTIACIDLVKSKGIEFISIVNVKNSTIDRMSKNVLYTKAGTEIAVASTKAYVAQVTVLSIFAIYLTMILDSNKEKANELLNELKTMHTKVQTVLESDENYLEYAKKIHRDREIFYLGRGDDYYTALEGSLKLKEISYIHSEALQLGELKHGPIALMENGTHTIVLCTDEKLLGKVISNIKEIKARGAEVMLVTSLKIKEKEIYDDIIELPEVSDLLASILSIIPLQLIAYHVAVLKDLDVDKPRNLAKSVTVE